MGGVLPTIRLTLPLLFKLLSINHRGMAHLSSTSATTRKLQIDTHRVKEDVTYSDNPSIYITPSISVATRGTQPDRNLNAKFKKDEMGKMV